MVQIFQVFPDCTKPVLYTNYMSITSVMEMDVNMCVPSQ